MGPAIIRIRPFRADDTTAVRALFAHWSDRSTYQRFFAMSPSLAAGYVDALNDPSRTLCAVVANNADGDVVGVGSTHRATGDQAEFGLAVEESLQGQGIGTRLLAALLGDAERRHVASLVAYVEAANHQMLEVIRDELPEAVWESTDGVVSVTVPVESTVQHPSTHMAQDVLSS